jgi:hypothetical protein
MRRGAKEDTAGARRSWQGPPPAPTTSRPCSPPPTQGTTLGLYVTGTGFLPLPPPVVAVFGPPTRPPLQ